MRHFGSIRPVAPFKNGFVKADSHRVTLRSSELGLVEDAYAAPHAAPPSGYEPQHQIVIPYYGLFVYCVGSKRWHLDSNGLLLISPGWDFQDEHPVPNMGHAALLITPAPYLLDEICHARDGGLSHAFHTPVRTPSMNLRLLTHHMLRMNGAASDALQLDELLIGAIREATNSTPTRSGPASRAVCLAKEILHASSYEHLSLSHIAREVGVSPVYLTNEFRRAEGIPLYRYQLRLRLSQGLAELPECEDITGLALDLGFGSHSHFSSAFRSLFGVTPSEYRASVGTRVFRTGASDGQHPCAVARAA